MSSYRDCQIRSGAVPDAIGVSIGRPTKKLNIVDKSLSECANGGCNMPPAKKIKGKPYCYPHAYGYSKEEWREL